MRRSVLGMIMLVLLALLTNCSPNKRMAVVQSDANTDVDFDQFKSYAFASQVDNQLDEGLFFVNDLIAKAHIRNAVSHELGSRGYEKSADSPDMVVNFRLFDKPTTISALGDMGENYWDGTPVPEPATPQSYQVEAGTLMVHLIDKESGKLLWQGFASGFMEGEGITHDKTKIQQAVKSLFDQFAQSSPDAISR